MAEFKIDLKKFFIFEATKNIIPSYKRLMTRGKGVKMDNAPKKKKGGGVWMVDTGETRDNGFLHSVKKTSLLIFANPAKHSGKTSRGYQQKSPPRYDQIFGWHNANRYSGVFRMLPVGSKFPDRLVKEVGNQVFKQIGSKFKGKGWK